MSRLVIYEPTEEINVSAIDDVTHDPKFYAATWWAPKFPNIRFIFSHGGGTVPFLLGRFERLAIERKDPWLKDGAAPQLRKFYYEIAQANHPGALDALMELVPLSNVLFGSDYPLRPASEAVEGLTGYKPFTDAQRRAINRENAERLVPRLKT